MKFFTLSTYCVILLQCISTEAGVQVDAAKGRQATIPSKEIRRKTVEVVETVDAASVRPSSPKPQASPYQDYQMRDSADVNPYGGGTGGADARRYGAGRSAADQKAPGAGSGGDFAETLRQITQQLSQNLGSKGDKTGDDFGTRMATMVQEVSKKIAADPDGLQKSVRQMTEQLGQNLGKGAEKGLDFGANMAKMAEDVSKKMAADPEALRRSVRQMTEQLKGSLGGKLGADGNAGTPPNFDKILKSPAMREATEAIGKIFGKNAGAKPGATKNEGLEGLFDPKVLESMSKMFGATGPMGSDGKPVGGGAGQGATAGKGDFDISSIWESLLGKAGTKGLFGNDQEDLGNYQEDVEGYDSDDYL